LWLLLPDPPHRRRRRVPLPLPPIDCRHATLVRRLLAARFAMSLLCPNFTEINSSAVANQTCSFLSVSKFESEYIIVMSLVDPPAGDIAVVEYDEIGLQFGYPDGWHEWTSPDFVAQGGVKSYTPDAVTSPDEEPAIVFSLLLCRDGKCLICGVC
jgi:hypothetical protein